MRAFRCTPAALAVLLASAGLGLARDVSQTVECAFEHFYNLEYDEAITGFKAAADAEPNSAEAWNHVAQGYFYSALFHSGMMSSDLLKSNEAVVRSPKLILQPDRDREFRAALERAVAISEQDIRENPRDTSALYNLGISLGLRANYQFLSKHAWFAGLKDANRSRRLHEEVVRLEPSNYDARLIPGTHEYMVGTMPFMVRLAARTAGVSGNRAHGLETIRQVALHGNRSRLDADVLLSVLYRREHRSRDGIEGLKRANEKYPRNFLFRFELARLYFDMDDRENALREVRSVEELVRRGVAGYTGERVALIRKEELALIREFPSGAVEPTDSGALSDLAEFIPK